MALSTDGLFGESCSILEAALTEAVERKRTPSLGQETSKCIRSASEQAAVANMYASNVDAEATNIYGTQLKTWVDMQVDARLDLLLKVRLDECMSEVYQEMAAVKDTQAKLFAVLESLAEEPARLSTAMKHLAVVEQANTALCKEVTSLRTAVEGCESSGKLHSAALFECEELVKHKFNETRSIELDEALFKKQVEESQILLRDELLSRQRRAVADLRNEMTMAVQNEAAAVAALDKRFYMLDQRVSKQLEELTSQSAAAHSVRVRSLERNGRSGSPDWSFCGGRVMSPLSKHRLLAPRSSPSSPTQTPALLYDGLTINVQPRSGDNIQVSDDAHVERSIGPTGLGEHVEIRTREPCSSSFWRVGRMEELGSGAS